jgi:hypothetical protein
MESISNYKDYDSELDLSDFHFSIKDIVKYDNGIYEVVKVLDDMIKIEKDVDSKSESLWISTLNPKLEIIKLYVLEKN